MHPGLSGVFLRASQSEASTSERDPFPAASLRLNLESDARQSRDHIRRLPAQNAGENKAPARSQGVPELGQGRDQQFAEEIGGHNLVSRDRFETKDVADHELDATDAIEPRVLASVGDGPRVVI